MTDTMTLHTRIAELTKANTLLSDETSHLRGQIVSLREQRDVYREQRDAQRRISHHLELQLTGTKIALNDLQERIRASTEYEVVFNSLPCHNGARLVEVEISGKSVERQWFHRVDGTYCLRFREIAPNSDSAYASSRADELAAGLSLQHRLTDGETNKSSGDNAYVHCSYAETNKELAPSDAEDHAEFERAADRADRLTSNTDIAAELSFQDNLRQKNER